MSPARRSGFAVESEDKARAIHYYDHLGPAYESAVSRGLLARFRERERAAVLGLARLDVPGPLSVIDVGCGTGFYALEAGRRGHRVLALDTSPAMLASLREKVDELRIGDVETWKTSRRFDRVLCAGVLDFVENPDRAMENLCRMVAPGGRLVVLCPRRGPGGWVYRMEKYWYGFGVNLYTRRWLKAAAAAHGLGLAGYSRPLPTNLAAAFLRGEPPSVGSRNVFPR